MGTGGTAVARATLAASLCAGCLASPPPAELVDPDAGASGSCTAGALIPGSAFNASPVDEQSACNVSEVEVRDGTPAGLDRRFGDIESACVKWDGDLGGCGCVGLDLGALFPVGEFVVRARPVGIACTEPCADGCGIGDYFTTWTGSERGVYTLEDNVEMTSDLFADFTIPVGQRIRYLVVCRDVWGENRDDVEIDSIEVRCE